MWQADDSDLDRAIDECARRMTAGDPDAGFRARVIAHLDLERLDRRATAAWSWPTVAAPLALAAALVIAVVTMSTFRWTNAPVTSPATTTMKTSEPTVTRAAPPETIAQESERSPIATDKRPQRSERGRAATLPESDVEKLAPARLDVASILVSEIGPAPSIEVPQLELITPITVAPLGEPQGERP